MDIPFLFDFWGVIQKVERFEEHKMALFSVLPKYRERNFCIPQILSNSFQKFIIHEILHLILGLLFCNVILHPQKCNIAYIKVILEVSIAQVHISSPNHFFSMWWLPARTILLKCRSYSTFLQLYLEERWFLWGHLTASCQYVSGMCQGEWDRPYKAVHSRMMRDKEHKVQWERFWLDIRCNFFMRTVRDWYGLLRKVALSQLWSFSRTIQINP